MTFVVTDSCILCKYTDCVDVCPVDCFYEGANMLVINPDECIDCGICEPECPAAAILPDSYPEAEEWLDLNREFSAKWPNIADSKPALPEAAEYLDRPAKFKEFFDPEPAIG